MTYLLCGEDTAASVKKLQEIIGAYQKKYGSLNVHRIDAEEIKLEAMREVLFGRSLFSVKKLVVVKYFFSSAWERPAFYQILENAKESVDTIVILWDRGISKTDVAEIRPYCNQVQEFRMRAGIKPVERTVFDLGDTFFTRRKEALRHLLRLLSQGHDDHNLFSYLANHARTVLAVGSHAAQGQAVPADFPVHPYVAKKAALIARAVPPEQIRVALRKFFEEDHKIKIGQSRPKDSLFQILLG